MRNEDSHPSHQTCERCGWVFMINSARANHEKCQSCRARKATKIKDCLAWHGKFDSDFVTPVDDLGNEVLPGRRSCGNSDCVNVAHVEKV